MIRDFISFSISNLKHRKLRSWLTILGIVIGIAAIISLITVGQGLEEAISSQFDKVGANRLYIVPKGLNFLSIGQDLTHDDVEVVNSMGEFKWVNEYLIQSTIVESGKEKNYLQITSNNIDNIDERWADLDFNLDKGRLWRANEEKSAVIGYGIAHDLFKKDIDINNNILINGGKFKVIGIFEEIGDPESDSMIHIPIDSARKIFNKEEEVSMIELVVKEGISLDDVSAKVKRQLKKARDNENFEVTTPAQLIGQLNVLLGIVNIVFIGIAAISLLVGGIGILNSMFTSVLERRMEIGIMKSIGATNNHILMIFLIEAGLVGLIGGLIGVVLGTGIAYLVKDIAAAYGFKLIKISVNPLLILFSMLFAFSVGIISGLIPAYKAARLKPVEALRYE